MKKTSISIILATVIGLSGCASTEGQTSKQTQGAQTGALIGAGLGLLIGAARGEPGAGLAVGAGVGAISGGHEGWKQDEEDNRTDKVVAAINSQKDTTTQNTDAEHANRALMRLVGQWQLSGWVQDEASNTLALDGELSGNISVADSIELRFKQLSLGADSLSGNILIGNSAQNGADILVNVDDNQQRLSGGKWDNETKTLTFEKVASDQSDERTAFKLIMDLSNPNKIAITSYVNNDTVVEQYQLTRS
ncbi:glycine zipper family protein [Shewanella sp. WXL01]|uniref:Glycine zipper family protein n=1 Tax=Shewanella maritima TaxID=2520507 RepID=A0A411PDL7_9GAMM|nr:MULTISPECIES: glycine zipper domain-containing protein [Shewanella]NKF50324.1 glycine zipper family protein [Shewanella sp. WXL01]QBF81655.1 glycine zipper family protein [Shewanella maritima]